MSALVKSQVVLLVLYGCLEMVFCDTRVNSNPDGNFAMGFTDGFINSGDYEVIIPPGNDEAKREILIRSPQVKDSVDMIFNTNTMVFSNWDGVFRLGDAVFTDKPGILYFVRSDHKCDKKKYQKLGSDIIPVDREPVDRRTCQAIKAKVENMLKHFLDYPFEFRLPEPDPIMKSSKGFPGGDYHIGKVYGNVYVGQHTVELPAGDSEKEREIIITAPGVKDVVTMKVNAETQIYGKWDGSFYIGDKVYTTEPRVLVIEDGKGGCVKKIFEDHGTTVSIAYTKQLKADDCFKIRGKVYDDMQQLIANPKLLAKEEKKAQPPQNPPPITFTSTVVYPNQDPAKVQSTVSGPLAQSTHTITMAQSPPGTPTASGNAPVNVQVSMAGNPPQYAIGNQSPQGPQPTFTPPDSGVSSKVHISTINSQHPDYPSVTATSVIQNSNQQQPQPPVAIQPQTVFVNQGQQQQQPTLAIQPQTVLINPGQPLPTSAQAITVLQPGVGLTNQQVMVDRNGQVQLLVPADSVSTGNGITVQPGNPPSINLQTNPGVPSGQTNAMNINTNNVKIQPDGSFQVGGGSLILEGLNPNDELILPQGKIRVGRSVNQMQPSALNYQTVSYLNQGTLPQVVTLSSGSQASPSNVQTLISVPQVQSTTQTVQHSTTVSMPGNNVPINSNVIVKSQNTQQNTPTVYMVQSPSTVGSGNTDVNPASNGPTLLKILPSLSTGTTVLNIKQTNSQTAYGNSVSQSNQNQVPQQPHVIFTSSPQGNTISMNKDKPITLAIQTSNAPQGNTVGSDLRLNIGNSGSAILINSQGNRRGVDSASQPSNTNIQANIGGGVKKPNSVSTLLRDLNLPSPVNNLIVNIAENTNFHKKKK